MEHSFCRSIGTVKLFHWNILCSRPWPYKTTVQLQKFFSKLKISSATVKLSTSNDLQYTVYICVSCILVHCTVLPHTVHFILRISSLSHSYYPLLRPMQDNLMYPEIPSTSLGCPQMVGWHRHPNPWILYVLPILEYFVSQDTKYSRIGVSRPTSHLRISHGSTWYPGIQSIQGLGCLGQPAIC